MAIRNFLRSGTREPLLIADVVFWIAKIDEGRAILKPLLHQGHAGLVAMAKPEGHSLGEDVVVYHMTSERIEKHRWGDGRTGDTSGEPHRVPPSRVDIGGTTTFLDENARDHVIHIAARFYARLPSKLSNPPGDTCYWLGDPSPFAHPQHPGAEGAYAFSCTTFVHHCYSEAALTLINLEDIPGAPLGSDRQWFENHGFPVQKDPLRRLRCGYLIGAFEAEQFPFQPNTWDYYLDELVFARIFANFPGEVVPYPAPEGSDPLSLRGVLEDVVDALKPESAP